MSDERCEAPVDAGRIALAAYLESAPNADQASKGMTEGPGGRPNTADRIAMNLNQ